MIDLQKIKQTQIALSVAVAAVVIYLVRGTVKGGISRVVGFALLAYLAYMLSEIAKEAYIRRIVADEYAKAMSAIRGIFADDGAPEAQPEAQPDADTATPKAQPDIKPADRKPGVDVDAAKAGAGAAGGIAGRAAGATMVEDSSKISSNKLQGGIDPTKPKAFV